MKKFFIFALVSLACSALAQTPPSVQQADATRQQRETENLLRGVAPGDSLPSLYEGEEEDVGPQSVLRKRKHRWLRVSYDGQAYYTDNMFFLREPNDIEAGVLVNTFEGALSTPPCITPYASYRAEVGYRYQMVDYFRTDDLDDIVDDFGFHNSTAFGELIAQTKHYQFRLGFDFTQLFGFEPRYEDDFEEFYRDYVPRWSVQRNIRLCDRSMLSLAYIGSYHFSDEDPLLVGLFPPRFDFEDRSERWEHVGLAAISVALPCKFVFQPYYRFQFTDYVNNEVREYLHTAGGALGWYPCENFNLRVFAGYNWNEASTELREYEKLDAGGGVNATLRF